MQATKTGNQCDAGGVRHFFVELDFRESEAVFHRLQVQTLPFIFRCVLALHMTASPEANEVFGLLAWCDCLSSRLSASGQSCS